MLFEMMMNVFLRITNDEKIDRVQCQQFLILVVRKYQQKIICFMLFFKISFTVLYAFFRLRLLYIAWRSDSKASQKKEMEEVCNFYSLGAAYVSKFLSIFFYARFSNHIFKSMNNQFNTCGFISLLFLSLATYFLNFWKCDLCNLLIYFLAKKTPMTTNVLKIGQYQYILYMTYSLLSFEVFTGSNVSDIVDKTADIMDVNNISD